MFSTNVNCRYVLSAVGDFASSNNGPRTQRPSMSRRSERCYLAGNTTFHACPRLGVRRSGPLVLVNYPNVDQVVFSLSRAASCSNLDPTHTRKTFNLRSTLVTITMYTVEY